MTLLYIFLWTSHITAGSNENPLPDLSAIQSQDIEEKKQTLTEFFKGVKSNPWKLFEDPAYIKTLKTLTSVALEDPAQIVRERAYNTLEKIRFSLGIYTQNAEEKKFLKKREAEFNDIVTRAYAEGLQSENPITQLEAIDRANRSYEEVISFETLVKKLLDFALSSDEEISNLAQDRLLGLNDLDFTSRRFELLRELLKKEILVQPSGQNNFERISYAIKFLGSLRQYNDKTVTKDLMDPLGKSEKKVENIPLLFLLSEALKDFSPQTESLLKTILTENKSKILTSSEVQSLELELSDLPARVEKILDIFFINQDRACDPYFKAMGLSCEDIEVFCYNTTAIPLLDFRMKLDRLNKFYSRPDVLNPIDLNPIFTEKLAARLEKQFEKEPIRYEDIYLLSLFRGLKSAQKIPLTQVVERILKTDFSKTGDPWVYQRKREDRKSVV